MILERKHTVYYDPRRRKKFDKYSMKVKSFGKFDPMLEISEVTGMSVSETRKLLSNIFNVYANALCKGYTVQMGDIMNISLKADSVMYGEEDKWRANKDAVKRIQLHVKPTVEFRHRLSEEYIVSEEYR